MESATMEDKKVGVGMLVLIAAAVLVWTQRAKILPPVKAAAPPTGVPGIESLSDLIPGFLPEFQTEAVIEQLQKDAVEDPAVYEIHLREAQGLPPDLAQRSTYYTAKTGSAELAEAYAQFDLARYETFKDVPPEALPGELGTPTNPTLAQTSSFATEQYWALEKIKLDPLATFTPGIEELESRQTTFKDIAENPELSAGAPLIASLDPEIALEYKAPAPAPVEEAPAAPAEEVAAAVAAATLAQEAAEAHNWDEAIAQAQTALEAAKQAEIAAGAVIPSSIPNLSAVDYTASMVYGAAMQAAAAAASSPSGYASGGYGYAGDFGYGAGVF